jgi:hypothetical protein
MIVRLELTVILLGLWLGTLAVAFSLGWQFARSERLAQCDLILRAWTSLEETRDHNIYRSH